MAGLLDFLTAGSYAMNPLSGVAQGLLSNLGPRVLDLYKNGAGVDVLNGPQYNPSGDFSGVQNPPPEPKMAAYPQGTDPMTAGGYPQSGPSSIAPPAPLSNPIAIGGGQNPYMMPRMGNPDQFEPQPASTDISAQSRQPQMQAPQQQMPGQLPPAFGRGGGNFLDNINNGLQSIGNGGSVIGALTGKHTDPQTYAQQNLSAQFAALSQKIGPEKAMLALLNPKAGENIFEAEFNNKHAPKSVEEFAVRNIWDNRGKPGAAAAASGGLPTTAAALQQWKLDEKAAEKRATTLAEKQGEFAAGLPDTLARAEQTIKQIDELKAHPAKGYRTGAFAIAPSIPGLQGKGVDFDERVTQMKGSAFLDAYKMLRGTGAISEKEGAKAEQAQARLKQTKDTGDFDQALNDLREVVVAGFERAQKMAGEEKIKPYEMPVGQSRTIGGVSIRRTK